MISPRTNAAGRRRAGFTLIELLVVVAIIGIILALVLPAFRGFGRSASMNASVAQIRSTLALSRQWAITKRQLVHFVVMDGAMANARPAEAWRNNRSYAVVYSEDNNMHYLKEWTALPPGIIFSSNNLAFPNGIPQDNVFSNWPGVLSAINVPFPTATSATYGMTRRIQFNTEGTIGNGNTVSLYLTEGTVETNGVVTPRANGAKFGLQVQELTGQIRVREYFSP